MNSSTNPNAFSFDTEFSEKGDILGGGSEAYKRYRPDEVEELCNAARQEGVQSVEAETERRIAAVAEGVIGHLQPVLPIAIKLAEDARREAAELAMTMAKKIAGAALEEFPLEAVQAGLAETLSTLPKGPKIILSVQPDIAERLEAAISPRLPGEINLEVRAEPSVATASWSLVWESGAFTHDPNALSEQLDALIQNFVEQPVDPQGDLFASVA